MKSLGIKVGSSYHQTDQWSMTSDHYAGGKRGILGVEVGAWNLGAHGGERGGNVHRVMIGILAAR